MSGGQSPQNQMEKGIDTMANTNTTTRKPTKRDNFTALLKLSEVKADPKLVEFITHEIDLLDRKNTVDKKPTATQVANEGIKADIKAFLDAHKGEKFTVSALMKSVPAIADASNQKVSSLVRQMVLDGQADRIEDKRKAYFTAK